MLDPDTFGFTLDSLTGLVTAVSPGGAWLVQGHVEELRTEPAIAVSVVAAPDSVGAGTPAVDTVTVAETESAAVAAVVFDLTTTPGQAIGLSGKRIVFRLADPVPGSPAAAGVALSAPGQDPGTDPHAVEQVSGAGGSAGVTAERVAGLAQPDSIVIEAEAFTARGTLVPGSPVRLLVFFLQN